MVVNRSDSRAINGVKTAELEVMPWKNSISGPLPVSRTFKVMRSMSTRCEMKWSEGVSAAMSMILASAARLQQKDHISRGAVKRIV